MLKKHWHVRISWLDSPQVALPMYLRIYFPRHPAERVNDDGRTDGRTASHRGVRVSGSARQLQYTFGRCGACYDARFSAFEESHGHRRFRRLFFFYFSSSILVASRTGKKSVVRQCEVNSPCDRSFFGVQSPVDYRAAAATNETEQDRVGRKAVRQAGRLFGQAGRRIPYIRDLRTGLIDRIINLPVCVRYIRFARKTDGDVSLKNFDIFFLYIYIFFVFKF